ncbi:MAG: acyl-ACP--UDP-N-acetylglucosamine O-acyltransferase [Schleiferiaceae bacterium]|jgi:UDP-N-acetylglucosamine acyltransferase|nr:acyl-ACP--UDP-N-acetylglucosamine O-acyltransferase [Schleiferiaceae bacterium]MDP4759336.1 acyl-ACP--UDP-N-acetylglucosamine O-acyltransferase [Schleiferiaceae bacterium]MDP4767874.1 acyl-ACP--UDP-N-acetylglucosamine O-acyltransferase [Schleiferiaceae bacterium]MDP4877066.1 acyl-ACP--UDP-N-acetylglucosamine O-acyltransferase [Schleiferiaceae bacterium]MDP4959041.1 acyl-ACP--UDP-N-acetylglucosamine O-acyltransferase [Schleiferiaceae bacterium]
MISPLASIHPDARIGADVEIGPFTTISADVEIGEGSWIGPNVTIMDGARIGSNCRIFPGAVISAIPQDLKFQGERTTVEIGDRSTIRECVTINRGTKAYGKTVVGKDCLIMAYVHIAHDCILGNHVILVNSVALAGHVEIGDYGIISGLSAVHQFVKIGAHVMIGGGAMVRKDVPPFITAAGEPLAYAGVNSVGLKRRNFAQEDIHEIQTLYRTMYQSGMNISQAVNQIKETHPNRPLADSILSFIEQSDRGLIRK